MTQLTACVAITACALTVLLALTSARPLRVVKLLSGRRLFMPLSMSLSKGDHDEFHDYYDE